MRTLRILWHYYRLVFLTRVRGQCCTLRTKWVPVHLVRKNRRLAPPEYHEVDTQLPSQDRLTDSAGTRTT